MTDWGEVTDYFSGDAIRPATREEWRRSADIINAGGSGAYTGAWQEKGIAVYVSGGPEATVTAGDIAALEQEAGEAGDEEQRLLCQSAFWGDVEAAAACVKVILDNRMT